jgi:Zn-dependent alcohol dehydrogenase
VLIGLSPGGERAEVELPRLFAKRARILVSHGGDHLPDDFPELAQWALDGKLDLASMVTRTAGLDGWRDAFDAMRDGNVIRTVLVP